MKLMKNKRGAALMQVLLVTAILAGIATFILRASLSRTSSARRTRRTISAQLLMDTCMAEVNTLWAAKDPQVFARDMEACIMFCQDETLNSTCSSSRKYYECEIPDAETGGAKKYKVRADMSGEKGACQVTYTVLDASGYSVL